LQNFLIREAEQTDVSWIKKFLEENGLTIVGVDEWYGNFLIAINERGSPVGVAGFEQYAHAALLRSVAVDKSSRNTGYARALVDAVVNNAKQKGVNTVYLLTENAEGYFKRLGFDVVEWAQVDDAVKGSPELTECCERATAMRKAL
jgi:N-acetylglutamate synthase-like GNAT family acetyltransferase